MVSLKLSRMINSLFKTRIEKNKLNKWGTTSYDQKNHDFVCLLDIILIIDLN